MFNNKNIDPLFSYTETKIRRLFERMFSYRLLLLERKVVLLTFKI
ncbi:hypothetical protein BDD39_002583 [Saccharococcus thermophilus]|uniref:Uncharacterized protein n=1 Tax=Saccharococcus thermophilus TaxID=29396 RepID=A0A846MKD0_9BACL|nr:hypothetical protein [Saccharococcus thermophilus]